jgi:SHAQKYF class myb-like DNA-binding protein
VLHKRFLKAIDILGGPDLAKPKQIDVIMNVDGLNVNHIKSHLQKYRMYLRHQSTGEGNRDQSQGQHGNISSKMYAVVMESKIDEKAQNKDMLQFEDGSQEKPDVYRYSGLLALPKFQRASLENISSGDAMESTSPSESNRELSLDLKEDPTTVIQDVSERMRSMHASMPESGLDVLATLAIKQQEGNDKVSKDTKSDAKNIEREGRNVEQKTKVAEVDKPVSKPDQLERLLKEIQVVSVLTKEQAQIHAEALSGYQKIMNSLSIIQALITTEKS